MIAAAGYAEAWTRSRLGPAADSEPPPPRAPPAVARLGPPSQRRADFACQFPLGTLIGNALTLAGFRGLAHHCSFSIGQENRTGLSAPRPGVVVGEKVRSLRGFRARSMRSDSIPQICADSYKFLMAAFSQFLMAAFSLRTSLVA